MYNSNMGLNSPPTQPVDQFQQVDQLPNADQFQHFEQVSQDELSIIQQLRRLQQQRAQHTPVVGRHEPLGMLTHDARQYLEIRQGFSPILVPTHMLTTVRQFISDHLPRHVQAERARQGLSPPHTPLPTNFSYTNNAPSLSSLGTALAQSSAALPASPPSNNYSVSSPLSSLGGGTPAFSSAMANFVSGTSAMANGMGLTSAPLPSSYTDADDLSLSPQEASESQATATPSASSSKRAKQTPAAKSRKIAKAPSKAMSSSPPLQAHNNGALDYFSSDDNESVLSDGKESSKRKARASPYNNTAAHQDRVGEYDDEESEEHLRKPPNAFILYRKAKNLELRTTTPGMNVEAASKLIGSSWKTEDEDVKFEYQEMARHARDLYFAKKKRIQAVQKVKKAEREELALSPPTRTIAKPRRKTSGSKDFDAHLVVATERNLGSFSPEALAPMPAMSHQEFAAIQA
ncbi:hypothetical protein GGI21_003862, partial [Coemansia aciculifera]